MKDSNFRLYLPVNQDHASGIRSIAFCKIMATFSCLWNPIRFRGCGHIDDVRVTGNKADGIIRPKETQIVLYPLIDSKLCRWSLRTFPDRKNVFQTNVGARKVKPTVCRFRYFQKKFVAVGSGYGPRLIFSLCGAETKRINMCQEASVRDGMDDRYFWRVRNNKNSKHGIFQSNKSWFCIDV